MYKVDPDALHLAQEFKAKPIGQHSAELQKLLHLFRGEAQKDKYVLVCAEPHKRWLLGRLTGVRGDPVRLTNVVFDDLGDAEWHVFKLRWKRHTGRELPD